MITNGIINFAWTLVSGIISILPVSAGFGSNVLTAASTIGGYFGLFAPIAPLGTIAAAVAIVFSVEIAIFGWKTLKSLVSHLPAIGGSGH